VDVDAHHYENESYKEVFQYIESPVIRHGRDGLRSAPRPLRMINSSVGNQNLGGRINPLPTCAGCRKCRRNGRHRDVAMTVEMDGFARRRLRLPVPDADAVFGPASASRDRGGAVPRHNRWLCERILRRRAAADLDALLAVQRSGSRLPDGEGFRRQERRRRLHGDLAALQAGARQRLYEDLRAARGTRQADLVPRRL